MLRTARLIIAAAAAAVALAVTTAPAHAAAIAYNEKTQILTGDPSESMPVSCTTRSLYLASGNYHWESMAIGEGDDWGIRQIYLGAAWYTWQDCLIPLNHYYEHTSTLYPPASTGWPAVTMTASNITAAIYNQPVDTPWGSELIPQW